MCRDLRFSQSYPPGADPAYLRDMPFRQYGFVFECDARSGKRLTNVRHRYVHASSRGFRWGCPDEGASDLALNVVAAGLLALRCDCPHTLELADGARCCTLAFELRPDFEQEFISRLPRGSAVLPWQRVETWLLVRMSMLMALEKVWKES